MNSHDTTEMKLSDLARRSGLSPRTIRYYISRGLLEGPLRQGRNASYTEGHLSRLQEIKEMQRDGLTLKEIKDKLYGREERSNVPPAESWQAYRVRPEVVVFVRDSVSPKEKSRIHRALVDFATRVEPTESGKEGGGDATNG